MKKKIVAVLIVSFSILFILTGCANSTSDYSTDADSTESANKNVDAVISTVVERAVEENEGWANAKFPLSFDDYHISKIGTDTYNTYGEFTRNGNIYKFDMDMETDGDNVTLKKYSVTPVGDY